MMHFPPPTIRAKKVTLIIPTRSMYAIFAYIGVVWGANVGKNGIPGASGIDTIADVPCSC